MHDVTQLLIDWTDGDESAAEALMPLIYDELKRRASRRLRHESSGRALETTELVHETYLRLVDQNSVRWRNRLHFFALAARMMRRILVDHARRRQASKRGAQAEKITFVDGELSIAQPAHLVAVDEALDNLRREEPEAARIVELRFFGGLTNEEIAELLGISVPTITRRWRLARVWLYRHLTETGSDGH